MKNQGAEEYGMSEKLLRSYAPNGQPPAKEGVQFEIHTRPERLVEWSTFDEDVGLATRMSSLTPQLEVQKHAFRAQRVSTTRSLESTSVNLFMKTFATNFTIAYIR